MVRLKADTTYEAALEGLRYVRITVRLKADTTYEADLEGPRCADECSTRRLQVDHGIRHDARNGELSGSARDDLVLQRKTPRAGDERLPIAIGSAHPNAQPLD